MADKKTGNDLGIRPVYRIRRVVLIVDRDNVGRAALAKILRSDYDLLFAETGEQALQIMRRMTTRLSLVLLDIAMAAAADDGNVLKEKQADETIAHIPVIVTTQAGDNQDEIKALSSGAMDFISRPYNPEIIQYRVANAIKLRESSDIIDMAKWDSVTGLYSRDFFFSYCEQIIQERRFDHMGIDILAIDVDSVKLVNELYGKEEADRVLAIIGNLMQDVISRAGGISCRAFRDIFLAILPHRTDYEYFLTAIFQPMEKRTDIHRVKLSFGIYANADTNTPINALCDKAIVAAHEARGGYRNGIVYYDHHMRERLLNEQMMIDGMQEAMNQRQFKIFFQPKCCLKSGRFIGAEALVRWIHPERGFMSPANFIPLFESNGMIYTLDRYVWETTCQYIRQWKDKYDGKCVPVSVNVSRVDIYDVNLPDLLYHMVQKYDLETSMLHLEITESAYNRTPELLINTVNRLRSFGFCIEMDDFGSGYSSLNMISKLPIDILKLDMKFMENDSMTTEEPGMLKYIMEMAQWMKLPVVAEGVETEKQVEVLLSLGCEYGQGYYFSRPVPADEFEQLMEENRKQHGQ